MGSLLAGRIGDARRGLSVALAVACAVIAASAFRLLPLLEGLIDLPFRARGARHARRGLSVALAVACAVIAASAFGLLPLLEALIDLPFAARVAITVALLAPAGIPLGMAMPLGLGRLAALYPRGVAWAWGVNGVASVVASAGAITI